MERTATGLKGTVGGTRTSISDQITSIELALVATAAAPDHKINLHCGSVAECEERMAQFQQRLAFLDKYQETDTITVGVNWRWW